MTRHVILTYYDISGHNFGIEDTIPGRKKVTAVEVMLPGSTRPETLRAISTYKTSKKITVRSPKIDKWLRNNSHVGQRFMATLEISEDGLTHKYYDFEPIWIV